MLPETPLDGAEVKAQALEQAIRALAIPHEQSDVAGGVITVSMGVVAATPARQDDSADLVRCADRLLYSAKHAGRGQIKVMQI